MNLCPLCGQRKSKRACPALSQTICATCCATKRLTEISCPPTCAYLSSARAHPAAVVQRRRDRDMRFLVPLLSDLSDAQYRLLLFLQAVVVSHAKSAIPALTDADIAEAARVVAATFETAGKGIIYEHQASSIPAQRLAVELGHRISEMRREGAPSSLERDATATLRKLEAGAKTAASALPDDEAPVFLGLLRRVMASVEEQVPDAKVGGTPAAGSGLIITG